jgi:hypothetical protein
MGMHLFQERRQRSRSGRMETPVSFVQLIILPVFFDNLFLDYVYRDRVGNDRRELEVFCLYTKLKCRVKRSVPIKLISQIY